MLAMMGKMARVLAKTQWYQTMQVVILFSTITHLQLKKKYFVSLKNALDEAENSINFY